jgi:hypothetical protein
MIMNGYKIKFQEAINCVGVTLNGFIESDIYRQALSELLIEGEKYNCYRWFIDTASIKFVSVKDQNWTDSVWIKQVEMILNQEPHFIAHILTKQFFEAESKTKLAKNSNIENNNIIQQYFSSIFEAQYWLYHQKMPFV